MLDVSIVTNNAEKSIFIVNNIFPYFKNLRLNKIIIDLENLFNKLSESKGELLIIDINLVNNKEEQFINIVSKSKLYTDIIYITDNEKLLLNLNKPNIYFLPRKEMSKYGIQNIITKWLRKRESTDINSIIVTELDKLNFNLSYKGTTYIIDILTLLYNMNVHEEINFKKFIYPYLAKKYNRTISSIKTSILNSIEKMYYSCSFEVFKDYFGIYNDFKLKPKEIIFTILNKIYRKTPCLFNNNKGKKIKSAVNF